MMPADVRIERREGLADSAQARAWAALWRLLLGPTDEPERVPEVTQPQVGGRNDA
jgi:hypothetical protein